METRKGPKIHKMKVMTPQENFALKFEKVPRVHKRTLVWACTKEAFVMAN